MMLLLSNQNSMNMSAGCPPPPPPPPMYTSPPLLPSHHGAPPSTAVQCAGCDMPIYDKFLYNVLDKTWHATCIQCADCKTALLDKCFTRNNVIYCKDDFIKRFGTRCAGCDLLIERADLVRRARGKVFHVRCFRCSSCNKPLETGEQLYIVNGQRFICSQDYANSRPSITDTPDCCASDDEDELAAVGGSGGHVTSGGGGGDRSLKSADLDMAGLYGVADLSPSTAHAIQQSTPRPSSDSSHDSPSKGKQQTPDENSSQGGAKRRGPRTTIKAKQLETLKAAFNATPKPTRHIREQLAQETGLNMRVIQVWFQNRRSKERRMKQLRFGGFRTGRRNRGGMRPDDPMVPPMYSGMYGEPAFFGGPPPPGVNYYCEPGGMFGPGGAPEGSVAELGAAPPPFMTMQPTSHGDDGTQSDDGMEDAHFILDAQGSGATSAVSPIPPITTTVGNSDVVDDTFTSQQQQQQFVTKSDVSW